MKGRIPKPTAVKKRNGNPGRRPLPKNEPQFSGVAKRPEWLNVGARAVWEDLFPVYAKAGLVTEGDGQAFGMMCSLASEFRADSVKMSANRISRLDALMQRFGMDPASRTRISVPKKDQGNDETRFFGVGA